MITSIFVGSLLTAALLKLAAAIVPGMKIDGWTPAISAAVITSVVGLGAGMLRPVLTALGVGGWPQVAIMHAISVLVLAIVIAITPGINDRGAVSVIATAILVRTLAFAAAMAYVQVITGEVSF